MRARGNANLAQIFRRDEAAKRLSGLSCPKRGHRGAERYQGVRIYPTGSTCLHMG